MKYLYAILRLFFCPHKYQLYGTISVHENGSKIGIEYINICKKCGKIKTTSVRG